MSLLTIEEMFLNNTDKYKNNKEIESLALPETMAIASGGVFENCESLEVVTFLHDITRIGCSTFYNCKNLRSIWFWIDDKNKIIEIADNAFEGCEQQITFHIYTPGFGNKYLTDYAKRHGFKVEKFGPKTMDKCKRPRH